MWTTQDTGNGGTQATKIAMQRVARTVEACEFNPSSAPSW
jgi:hypothetical protein